MSFSRAAAQDDTEYRLELGGGLGLRSYQGDFSGSLLAGMKPSLGLVAKYKVNPRMAWALQIATGKLGGSSKDADTWYPELWEQPVDFKTSVTDVTVRYEYNFWPFGTGREYLGARPLTPFITVGAGLVFAGKAQLSRPLGEEPGSTVAFQVPLGLGVKYKLRDRLNLVAEWTMHFTGTDGLDSVKDPYGIESSGLFKNTDCFSQLQLSLTYDLWAKCKTCHNDRD